MFLVLVLAVLTAGMLVAAPQAAGAVTAEESEFVQLLNDERTSRGLRALAVKSDLLDICRRWSRHMRSEGDISHNPNLADEVPGNWTVVGENVGMGHSVDGLHDAFMDSPGHRANVLDREYNQVAAGVVIDDDGMIFVTFVFAHRAAQSTAKPKPKPSSSPTQAAPAKPASTRTVASRPQGAMRALATAPRPIAPAGRNATVLWALVGPGGVGG